MFSQPHFLAGQVTGNPQGQALFAQQYIAAVAAADAPDGIVFREVQDEPPVFVQVGLAVQASGEFAARPQCLHNLPPRSCHNEHI
ncbi:MAG: hypothetical protein BWY71_01917 [Planctomycetes bacterium ADurb.Bin412]|nr:MAG: hypothetical protein BWY71_01917 [Planctomycetes bacterium ADurb.Bin412]